MADAVDPAEGQDNPGRPDWLPENFNSPEDLAKSYRELQGRFTQESQARAALEDNYATIAGELDELRTALTAQPQQQADPNQQAQYLAEQFGVEPEYLNATALIAQQIAQQTVQEQLKQFQPQQEAQAQAQRDLALRMAGDTLRATYPDFDEKLGKVQEVLESNPDFIRDSDYLSLNNLVDRIGSVYKQVSYDELVNGTGQESGQPDMAALAQRMKLNAQTATGASGRPDPVSDDKAAWDAIRNAKPTTYYT